MCPLCCAQLEVHWQQPPLLVGLVGQKHGVNDVRNTIGGHVVGANDFGVVEEHVALDQGGRDVGALDSRVRGVVLPTKI